MATNVASLWLECTAMGWTFGVDVELLDAPKTVSGAYGRQHADDRTPYDKCRDWLASDNITCQLAGLEHGAMAVLMAEVCNAAAKLISPQYYDLKPDLIEWAASQSGVLSGWGDDGAFYLHHPSVGTCCFHDPHGQIGCGGEWLHPWHGIQRQFAVFEAYRLGHADLISELALDAV